MFNMTKTLGRKLWPLLLILLLVLAACGGDDDSGSNGDTNGNGDTVSDTTNGDSDASDDRENTIRFTVSGDAVAEGTVETRSWATQDTPADLGNPDPNSFSMLLYAELMSQMVTFNNLPYDITPGDYALTSPGDAGPDELNVNYVHDMTNIYSTDVSGTLTVDSVGETIAGSFNFTATKDTDASITITVEGEFSNVNMPTPPEESE